MSLWSFLTGWGSTIGAGAYIAKEVGVAAKNQINFEVREQYRKKFFDEWVDEDLEKRLRDDLSTPSKYNEIWERIEKYKQDEGEVYLMRKLFGEKQGWRYFWGDVGEKRLPIRNKNGKYATGYTAKEYNDNFWKTMSLLMNTYEKLTADDAFYIFDICYNSIDVQYGVEVMNITFNRKRFRDNGRILLGCAEFEKEWRCTNEFEERIKRELRLDPRTDSDYKFWRDDSSADRKFDEIWTRIENYKKGNGKTCAYLLKLERLQRELEQATGKQTDRVDEKLFCMPLKDVWTNVGKRRLPFSERQENVPIEEVCKYKISTALPWNSYPLSEDPSKQQIRYYQNMRTALALYINTFDKMPFAQSFITEHNRREFNM